MVAAAELSAAGGPDLDIVLENHRRRQRHFLLRRRSAGNADLEGDLRATRKAAHHIGTVRAGIGLDDALLIRLDEAAVPFDPLDLPRRPDVRVEHRLAGGIANVANGDSL